MPPLSWLSQHGAKVKVLHEGQTDDDDKTVERLRTPESSIYYDRTSVVPSQSTIQLSIGKEKVERRLSTFRMHGFSNEDLFTMLDKGPWILAFTSEALPRLVKNLKEDIGFNSSEVCHIISHCPYLVAQYSTYKGRDVYASAMALMDAGYEPMKLLSACMRFPSMLAAPPDRIAGWKALIQNYGIARSSSLFSKLMSKATYMFYIDPPLIWDSDEDYNDRRIVRAAVDPAEGTVVYESKRILKLLQSLKLHDVDKTVRTQPFLLLEDEREVYARIIALKGIFADCETSVFRARLVNTNTTACIESPISAEVNNNNISDPNVNIMDIDQRVRSAVVAAADNDVQTSVNIVDDVSGDERTLGDNSLHKDQELEESHSERRVMNSLRSVITTYPAVLAVNHYQIKACIGTLRSVGLGRYDIMQLVRRYPAVLGRDIATLEVTFNFLKERCGLSRMDLIRFISRHPSILGRNFDDLQAKVNYFYKSLAGTSTMLTRCPSYLVYDLDKDIRPRAEFLIAFGMDPLFRGLSFLVSSSSKEIAAAVNVDKKVYEEFSHRFGIEYIDNDVGKKRKLRRKDVDPEEYAQYFEKEGRRKIIEVIDLFPDIANKNLTEVLSAAVDV